MGLVMAKSKKPTEAVTGRYTAIPHALLDSVAFMGASHRTRSLVFDLMRQHDGKNNGHFHLALSWLRARGWASADGVQKAKQEALERGLITKTRSGGLNIGPDRYALTWLPITNFVGLDITQKDYHPGAYLLMDKLPTSKGDPQPAPVRHAAQRTVKRNDRSARRNGTTPLDGMAEALTVPSDGTKTALFGVSTIPPDGNNVCIPVPPSSAVAAPGPRGGLKRIVGQADRSGKPKQAAQAVDVNS